MVEEIWRNGYIGFFIIGAGMFITSFIFATWFSIISHKVLHEFKNNFLHVLLIQEQEWYDEQDIERQSSEFNSYINDIENATDFRTSAFICLSFSASIISIVILYWFAPIYATCLLVSIPIIIFIGHLQSHTFHKKVSEETNSYLASSADAEQALNSIKIVKAFGQENYEVIKFEEHSKTGSMDRARRKYAIIFGITETVYYFTLT